MVERGRSAGRRPGIVQGRSVSDTMDARTFWTLKRTTSPQNVFEKIVPALPDIFPVVTIACPVNIHVLGVGGGIWSVQLIEGRLVVRRGAADDALCQVAMERKHLREVVGGALRDAGLRVMAELGRPGQLPDLKQVPVEPQKWLQLAELGGSVAIEIEDRQFRDTYRYVITFGGGAPDYERTTTSLRFDLEQMVRWSAQGQRPVTVLRGGRIRIEGDLALAIRAVRMAFGDAAG